MAGYTRVDTGNNIADGNVISATDLDNEFDGIQAAFNASTGHNHDGTTGEGAPILVLGPTQDVVVGASTVTPKTTNTVDIGSSSLKFKDLWLAGNVNVAGTTTLGSALTYGGVTLSNAVTGTGNMVLSASPTLTGTLSGANASLSGTLAVTGIATLTAQPILSSLTASRAVFTDSSKGLVSNAITGTGNVVMSASPTLTGTISAEALTTSGTVTLNGGTANGVAYLDGSKVLTTGSALTYNGTNLLSLTSGAIRLTDAFELGWGTNSVFLTGSSTSNVMQFITNGSEQMRLTSTGLGIGTSSPAFTLDISAAAPRIRQVASTGTNSSLVQLVNTGGTAFIGLDNSSGGLGGAYSLNLFHTGAYPIVFSTSGSERMRLDSSGNLGIGTSSPITRLSNTATAWAGGTATDGFAWRSTQNDWTATVLATPATGAGYGLRLHTLGTTASDYPLWISSGAGSGSVLAAMTGAGNLGIGTSSPTEKLQVNGGIITTGAFNGVNPTGGSVILSFSSSTGSILSLDPSVAWKNLSIGSAQTTFSISGSEAMRLDSNGNLLVGTTSGGQRLVVAGVSGNAAALITSANTSIGAYFSNVSGTANYDAAQFLTNGGATVVGSIVVSSTATTYATSSDYRLKNITGPITTSGAYIDSLNPVEGTWKADGSTFVGLIAHEVQEASRTQVATGVKDGEQMQGMDYSSAEIIANLIAEVKALRARVAALESI